MPVDDDKNSELNIKLRSGAVLKSNMTEFNISQTLKLISPFDGNPSQLHQFIQCSDIVFDELHTNQHAKFLQLMKKLLIGTAYDETVKHIEYDNWLELKKDLKDRFSDFRSKLEISHELNTIHQNPNETVREFGSRTRILLSQLNDLCITEAGKGSKKTVELLNNQTALVAFQEGLNNKIRIIVKSANCKTLKESIVKACEEESLINRQNNVDLKKDCKCQLCGKIGHFASNCFKLKSRVTESKMSYYKNNNKPNLSSSFTMICAYCKNPGHHINDCFKRKHSEIRKTNSNTKHTISNNSSNNSSNKFNIIKSEVSENLMGLTQSTSNKAVRAKFL